MPSQLFSPISLRDLKLENRIVVSPMCQYASQDGCASDWHVMHLGGFALSGVGLLITEATGVMPEGRISPGCLGLYSDDTEKSLARVLAFCREHGSAKLGIQLAHAGRKGSTALPWHGAGPLALGAGGWITAGPSAVPFGEFPPPRPMTRPEMDAVKDAFVAAVRRSERLGFDLIEMHFAHGYLMHTFLSPLSNRRDDAYGGDRAGRMRFPLEVFEAARAAWPAHKPMGVRLSTHDWLDGGWTDDDSVVLARELKARDCDYICASSGGLLPGQGKQTGAPEQIAIASRIRADSGIATIAIGSITEASQAEAIVAEGKGDLVALAKGMLMDPRWAWHAAIKLGAEFTPPPRYRAVKAVLSMVK